MYVIICISILVTLSAANPTPSSSSASKVKHPSHLMLDYNWPEPDSRIKKYPHEKYCNFFYNKEDENMYTVRKCPKGEIFDYHIHECKEKAHAQCWSNRYGKTKVHDHIHSKWRQHFKCPFSTGKYPDAFHCAKYFVCENGNAIHKHCPPHKKFDRVQRHCVDKNIAQCANISDAIDIAHKCPKHSGNIGHPKDCSKYYHCHANKPKLMMCDRNKLFDEKEKNCKNKEHVQCGSRLNPYNDRGITKETTSTLPTSTDLSETVATKIKTSLSDLTEAVTTKEIKSTLPDSTETVANTKSTLSDLTGAVTTKDIKSTLPDLTKTVATKEIKSTLPDLTQAVTTKDIKSTLPDLTEAVTTREIKSTLPDLTETVTTREIKSTLPDLTEAAVASAASPK